MSCTHVHIIHNQYLQVSENQMGNYITKWARVRRPKKELLRRHEEIEFVGVTEDSCQRERHAGGARGAPFTCVGPETALMMVPSNVRRRARDKPPLRP